MKKSLFLCLLTSLCVCASCKEEEIIIVANYLPRSISADVVFVDGLITEPVKFEYRYPTFSPHTNKAGILFPNNADYAYFAMGFNMIYEKYSLTFELYYEHFLFEYDKTYYLNDRSDLPEVLSDDIDRYVYAHMFYDSTISGGETVDGWVKFTNRRVYCETVYVDVEFAFAMYNDETGELELKVENGKALNIGFGNESKFLKL